MAVDTFATARPGAFVLTIVIVSMGQLMNEARDLPVAICSIARAMNEHMTSQRRASQSLPTDRAFGDFLYEERIEAISIEDPTGRSE